jgi:indole-3-glycerol phosphate synthase
MKTKLDEIMEVKAQEVALAKAKVSLSELKARIADLDTPKDFRGALNNSPHPTALIAEVKKASPSQGLIRANFDPVAIADTYARAGADCLSVLTDEKFFMGSPEYLQAVRKAVDLPILRKDFVCDAYQIYEARAWGADAVLLIVRVLSDEDLRSFYETAKELGLSVLVEVADEEDMERAQFCDLVGINNRDLRNFNVDTQRTTSLIQSAPADAVIVSESGIETYDQIQAVSACGARAVLIGTTFCRSEDIEAKVREVMQW